VEIPNNADQPVFPSKDFDFLISPGCVCIVAISLQFFQKTYAGEMGINSKELNPVGIFRAFLSEDDPQNNPTWGEMNIQLVLKE